MINDNDSKLAGKKGPVISKITINLKRGYERTENRKIIDEN